MLKKLYNYIGEDVGYENVEVTRETYDLMYLAIHWRDANLHTNAQKDRLMDEFQTELEDAHPMTAIFCHTPEGRSEIHIEAHIISEYE